VTEADDALLRRRIVMLGAEIDEGVATTVVAKLLLLESEDAGREIELRINSPGGSVIGSLAIHDAMHMLKPPVATFCSGRAGGGAALLLASGARGRRRCSPEAVVSLVPLAGGAKSPDELREVERLTDIFLRLLVGAIHRPHVQIVADMERGRSFGAEEALRYGFVDAIA